MSAEQHEETIVQESARGKNKKIADSAGRKKKSAMEDAYVRNLLGIAALVVIGALLTIVFAVLNGVIDFDRTRATNIDEFTINRAMAYVEVEGGTAGSMSELAIAQIENGQFLEAERTIQDAFARNAPDEERNQGPMFAYALLALRQGHYELAIERYEITMRDILEAWQRMYDSDEEPNWARAFGLHPNYYDSALELAFLYGARGDYDEQLVMLNIAAQGMPTNADIFIWRGQVKLARGDNEGAIEDFNQALRFIPNDEAALRGLEEAGGTIDD